MRYPLLIVALIAAGCSSAKDKAEEQQQRRELALAYRTLATTKGNCALAPRDKETIAVCADEVFARMEDLRQRENIYRAACLRCASAEKCEAEVRRLRDIGERAGDETACP